MFTLYDKEGYSIFERRRRPFSALFLIVCMAVVLVTHHSWAPDGLVDRAFDIAGVVLTVIGVSGRLWATMYIGGRKNAELVTDGPYSMCRNPLYFFSFVAGLGVCLEFENLILLTVFVIAFSLYYPFVIRSEERRLEGLFGAGFAPFKENIPAFFPKFKGLRFGSPVYSPKLLWKNFWDGSIFLFFIPAAIIVELLHESGVLPVYLRIP